MNHIYADLETAVRLLSQIDAAALTSIRAKPEYEEYRDLLLPHRGAVLGSADDKVARALAESWSKLLKAAASRADERATSLHERLERAERLELMSEIGGAIGGSMVVALIVSPDSSQIGKVVMSGVTLACTIASLVVRYLRTTIGGKSMDRLAALLKLIGHAQVLSMELDAWLTATAVAHSKLALSPELQQRARAVVQELPITLGLQ